MTAGRRLIAALLCVLCFASFSCPACTTILVGKDVSPTGRVIVGHNEDDAGEITVSHYYVPPRDWEEDYILPSDFFRADIPQVPHTSGYYWSEVKDEGAGVSYADSFYNDNGVYIASNSCADSREDEWDFSTLTDGGIEYNLRRIVAERAQSARDGVDIIISLINEWGYGPSGRAYTVADRDEAWIVQIVHGRQYIAIRCPDDQVAVIPNHYTAHNPSDYADVLYPETLISFAKERGYWSETDGPFDFAKAYQAPYSYMVERNTLRNTYALSMITGTPFTGETYPFSVTPNRKFGLDDIAQILSSHYEGTENFPASEEAPHNTDTRTICYGTTAESTIVEFAEKPLLSTLWVAFGNPCVMPYVPLHPLAGVPRSLGHRTDPSSAMDSHLEYDWEEAGEKENGIWQRMQDWLEVIDADYAALSPAVKSVNEGARETERILSCAAVQKAADLLASGEEKDARNALASADAKALSRAFGRLYNAINY